MTCNDNLHIEFSVSSSGHRFHHCNKSNSGIQHGLMMNHLVGSLAVASCLCGLGYVKFGFCIYLLKARNLCFIHYAEAAK